jgi:sterol desaturase/sphingolipid hydroxylase (fatty acid hydroxylase superfamily)
MVANIGWCVAGFMGAFVFGIFVECAIHYLMHKRIMLGNIYILHHSEGTGQAWWGEFLVYFLPAVPFLIGCFVFSWLVLDLLWLGIGIAAGGSWYAAFAAYSHQVQHEQPELAFWMRRPVHTIHHVHNMWRHNFGISLDWWDHVFGTYKRVEWQNKQPIKTAISSAFIGGRWPISLRIRFRPMPKRRSCQPSNPSLSRFNRSRH